MAEYLNADEIEQKDDESKLSKAVNAILAFVALIVFLLACGVLVVAPYLRLAGGAGW